MGIIMRMINGLITLTATLVLLKYVCELVIVYKNKANRFRFNISNVIIFLVATIINLYVIYGVIWIIKFFAIKV